VGHAYQLGTFVLTFVSCIILATSCSKPVENIAKREGEFEKTLLAQIEIQKERNTSALNWEQALGYLLKNNLELKNAQESLRLAKEQKDQIFWDLVPTLSLSANLSKAFEDLGTISEDDIRLSLFSSVNLPGIISFYSRHYGALLGEIKADTEYWLKRRQLIIRLRELFLKHQDFRQRFELKKNADLISLKPQKSILELLSASPEELLAEQQEYEERMGRDRLNQETCKLLGNYQSNWDLLTDGLPEFNYAERNLDLNNTENVGVLLRKKQAIDLESLRLTKVLAKLNFFPDINFGVSAPALYSNSSPDYRFNADRIIISASTAASLDTNLRKTRNLKRVERQIELQHEIMREEIERQVSDQNLAITELKIIEKELQLAELRLDATNSFELDTDVSKLRTFLEKRTFLIQQVSTLRQQKAGIEGAFWLLDESMWDDEHVAQEALKAENL